jgi:hypothetical protein
LCSIPLWNKALAVEAATGAGGIDTGVVSTCINPNSDMAGFIFKQGMRENAPSCEISIKVLSMVTLTTEIDSIAPLLSGPVGDGLRNYDNNLEMFDNPLIKDWDPST